MLEQPLAYALIGFPLFTLPLVVGFFVGARVRKSRLPELLLIPLAAAAYFLAVGLGVAGSAFGLVFWGPPSLIAVGIGIGKAREWRLGPFIRSLARGWLVRRTCSTCGGFLKDADCRFVCLYCTHGRPRVG
jgi:hypothetical protein